MMTIRRSFFSLLAGLVLGSVAITIAQTPIGNLRGTSRARGSVTALSVELVDASGNQVTSFGAGTQYTEGDVDATITGTALLWEDAGNVLTSVTASTPLPVSVIGTTTADTELAAAVALGDNLTPASSPFVFALLYCWDGTNADRCADTTIADEGTFTYATSRVQPFGAVAESTTDSLSDGQVGAPVMTTTRQLVVTPQPGTNNGLSIYRSIDLDEGTGEVIKASPGQLYSLWVTNTATTTRFVKIYDATSCTIGTGTPVITVGVPGNASDDIAGHFTAGGYGITFATGICFGAVTAVADADTGAPGANDVIANAFYK